MRPLLFCTVVSWGLGLISSQTAHAQPNAERASYRVSVSQAGVEVNLLQADCKSVIVGLLRESPPGQVVFRNLVGGEYCLQAQLKLPDTREGARKPAPLTKKVLLNAGVETLESLPKVGVLEVTLIAASDAQIPTSPRFEAECLNTPNETWLKALKLPASLPIYHVVPVSECSITVERDGWEWRGQEAGRTLNILEGQVTQRLVELKERKGTLKLAVYDDPHDPNDAITGPVVVSTSDRRSMEARVPTTLSSLEPGWYEVSSRQGLAIESASLGSQECPLRDERPQVENGCARVGQSVWVWIRPFEEVRLTLSFKCATPLQLKAFGERSVTISNTYQFENDKGETVDIPLAEPRLIKVDGKRSLTLCPGEVGASWQGTWLYRSDRREWRLSGATEREASYRLPTPLRPSRVAQFSLGIASVALPLLFYQRFDEARDAYESASHLSQDEFDALYQRALRWKRLTVYVPIVTLSFGAGLSFWPLEGETP